MAVDEGQLVRLVSSHSRKLERLETLPVPSGAHAHHTLCVFDAIVDVHTIGRIRLLPGAGLKYVPISWSLNANVPGNVLVDILAGSGYPPATSACWANKPRLLGQVGTTGVCTGWNNRSWPHGYYLIINVESYSAISQLGFSLELAVELV